MRSAAPAVATLIAAALLAGCSREAPPATPDVVPDSAPATGDAVALDPRSGLKMARNWQLVRAACTECHSAKLVTQQRGSKDQWLTMIRWMQKKQNLWQFDAITEHRIITYLAENYAPEAQRRRAPIPPELMPPNPYRPE